MFLLNFDQINAVLLSIRNFFQKHENYQLQTFERYIILYYIIFMFLQMKIFLGVPKLRFCPIS